MDDYKDEIGKKVYELTWAGQYWGKNGSIKWSYERYKDLKRRGKEGRGAMAHASTYYAARGHALARHKLEPFYKKPLWSFRFFVCLFKALYWSGRAEKNIGLKNMDSGQLDIRASILASAGFYWQAIKKIEIALGLPEIPFQSEVLLRIKLAEIYDKEKFRDKANNQYHFALNTPGLPPTVRVRVLKSAGSHFLGFDNEQAERFLLNGLKIAKENNLGDQIVKIEALLKQLQGK